VPASWNGGSGAAAFSGCGRYRWWLVRPCQPSGGSAVLFLGLNPSRADGERDDPTLRRLRGLAGRWGHGRLLVMNLFARVAPDPALLRRTPAPVGDEGDGWLAAGLAWLAAQPPDPCGPPPRIWVGWGQQGGLHGRSAQVLEVLRCWGGEVVCVGLTRQGQPRHPLYCRADQAPQPFVVANPHVSRPPLLCHPPASEQRR
jgi:hypothetical protein